MADRERLSQVDAQVRELDRALAELLLALDRAHEHHPNADRDPEGHVSLNPAAEAVRRLVAAFPTRPDLDGGHDVGIVAARARSALDELGRHAKAEHRRCALEAANADEWERNAKLAVRAGDDNLAPAALANRAVCARRRSRRARSSSSSALSQCLCAQFVTGHVRLPGTLACLPRSSSAEASRRVSSSRRAAWRPCQIGRSADEEGRADGERRPVGRSPSGARAAARLGCARASRTTSPAHRERHRLHPRHAADVGLGWGGPLVRTKAWRRGRKRSAR